MRGPNTVATSDAVVPTKARKNPSMNPEKERSNIHHNPTESADRVRANSISFAKLIFWRQELRTCTTRSTLHADCTQRACYKVRGALLGGCGSISTR